MGIITKIEIGKRNKERVNVFIDGEFAFACSSELVYYHSLSKEKEIDMNEMQEIIDEDNYIKGKNKALKYIEKSYKTEKQVCDYLQKKEYNEKTIARIMEFLHKYSFIDDFKYTKMYIEYKYKKEGLIKIKHDLKKKGINEELVEKVWNSLNVNDIQERIQIISEKRMEVLIKSETNIPKIKKKMYDYLTRKGFSSEDIGYIINKLIDKYSERIKEKSEAEYNEEDARGQAFDLAEKRYNIITKSETNILKIKKKLNDYLLRRGYSYEITKEVLNEIVKK